MDTAVVRARYAWAGSTRSGDSGLHGDYDYLALGTDRAAQASVSIPAAGPPMPAS